MNKQQEQESFVTRWIKRDPMTLYDIGVGPKTEGQTLLQHYPHMELFGAEPLLDEFSEMINFPGTIFQTAITSYNGEIVINFNSESMLDAGVVEHKQHDRQKLVQCITLDAFDQLCCTRKCILLWMDIEGMELNALQGGEELLSSHRVRWINLEVRKTRTLGYCTADEIHRHLVHFGYRLVGEYNKHKNHMDVFYRYNQEKR